MRYLCWGDGYGEEDGWSVEARDPREAAERYSELRDQGGTEYDRERVIFVRTLAGVEAFEVVLHMVPEYEARKRKV